MATSSFCWERRVSDDLRELTIDEEIFLRHFSDSIIIKDVRSQERLIDEVALFLHRVVQELPETYG